MPRRRTPVPEAESETWMRNQDLLKQTPVRPIPVVGVELHVRILMRSPDDWRNVEEVIDKAREYGSCEVAEYRPFPE